jgi:predicted AAA+ superfamily ATPase
MEKHTLKELIAEHKSRFFSRGNLTPRDAQKSVNRLLQQREIVFITGVRRCGKSSLMRLVCDDLLAAAGVALSNILYVNFEDERLASFKSEDCERLMEAYYELEAPSGKVWLFLDEIQNVPAWEKWLNRLYEFEEVKIFVTGSNMSLMGSELSTALTGRNRQVVLWPFSFREFLVMRASSQEETPHSREWRANMARMFDAFLQSGGFPEALKQGDPALLEQYWQDILYRDIFPRYGIRNIREIRELTLFLASNSACIHSYKSLQGVAGVKSQMTVCSYLQALHDVFLFFPVDLFDYSVKRQIYNPSKMYGIDTGMLNAVSFSFSRDMGHSMENAAYIELRRRGYEVYYWKSLKGGEVDFLIREKGAITTAIQVCFSLADAKTRRREIDGLVAAAHELKVERLILISGEAEETITEDGCVINVLPMWKWLLGEG